MVFLFLNTYSPYLYFASTGLKFDKESRVSHTTTFYFKIKSFNIVWNSLVIYCMSVIAPLFPVIINGIQIMYVIYLRFVLILPWWHLFLTIKGFILSLLSHKNFISVCPKDESFIYLFNIASVISIRPSLSLLGFSSCL